MSSRIELAPRGWSDRLNPVLVKDLRAMLRGRFLRVLLLATVALVLGVTLWNLSWADLESKPVWAGALYVGVYWAAHALIAVVPPMWAFALLGQELEEGTFDLLAVTRISPWKVVLGKFLVAIVLAAVIACAVAPFAWIVFLLDRIDAGFVVIGGMLVSAAYSSAIALTLSCLTRIRWARTLLLTGLFCWLAWEQSRTIMDFSFVMRIGPMSAGGPSSLWILPELAVSTLQCGLLLAFAGGHLAHPEESRSTPMRAWCLVLVVVLAVGGITALLLGANGSMLGLLSGNGWLACLVVVFLVSTEPDVLPRSFRRAHDAGPLRRAADLLLVSGGGRGILLSLVLIVLASAFVFASRRIDPGTGALPLGIDTTRALALPCIYILLPAGLLAARNRSVRATAWIRAGIVGFACAFWVLYALGRLVSGSRPNPLRNLFSPFVHSLEFGTLEQAIIVLLVLAAIAVNVPRMLRGAREVLARDAVRRGERA